MLQITATNKQKQWSSWRTHLCRKHLRLNLLHECHQQLMRILLPVVPPPEAALAQGLLHNHGADCRLSHTAGAAVSRRNTQHKNQHQVSIVHASMTCMVCLPILLCIAGMISLRYMFMYEPCARLQLETVWRSLMHRTVSVQG